VVSWRAREFAKQARCREQNETTALACARSAAGGIHCSFRCECGDAKCRRSVTLTLSEYELVRGDATHFAVTRDHENPEGEHVIEENARFAVVELVTAEATKLARRTDPRQRRRERCWRIAPAPRKPNEGG
jgi:hypothetical protein